MAVRKPGVTKDFDNLLFIVHLSQLIWQRKLIDPVFVDWLNWCFKVLLIICVFSIGLSCFFIISRLGKVL